MAVGKIRSFAIVGYRHREDPDEGPLAGTEMFALVRPYDVSGIQKIDACGSFIISKTAVRKKLTPVYIHITYLLTVFHRSPQRGRGRSATYYFVPVASTKSNIT